jgi:hypothetical protein
MKRRYRIGLGESLKLAAQADMKPGVGGGGNTDWWAMLTVGLWYWIAGVPESADRAEGGADRDRAQTTPRRRLLGRARARRARARPGSVSNSSRRRLRLRRRRTKRSSPPRDP